MIAQLSYAQGVHGVLFPQVEQTLVVTALVDLELLAPVAQATKH